MSEESLRALIRHLHLIISLRNNLEQSIHLESYAGLGNAAVKTYAGLRDSIARFVEDPYLDALTLEVPADAGDKEKVSLVWLVAGQLLAYVQGQLGLSLESASTPTTVQNATNINISGSEAADQAMEITKRALGRGEEGSEPQDV